MKNTRNANSMNLKPLTECDEFNDVIFRFRLNHQVIDDNPEIVLMEFFKGQIQDLLRVVALTYEGKRLFIDGFHFLQEPEVIVPLWSQSTGHLQNNHQDMK